MTIDNLKILEQFWNTNTNSVLVVCEDQITQEIKTFFGSYLITPEVMQMASIGIVIPDTSTNEGKLTFVIAFGEKIDQDKLKSIFGKYI